MTRIVTAVCVILLVATAGAVRPAFAAGGQSNLQYACNLATAPGFAHCFAILNTAVTQQAPGPNFTPAGYGPTDLHSAYRLPTTGGTGKTVAVVDAFDDPNAEADLQKYRSQYGLPVCTTGNGCFKKVNQTGGNKYPRPDVGWSQEISLDLDMVSAICPSCHILLVESTDNNDPNLAVAVDEAATLGASAISNSYGEPEYQGQLALDSHWKHAGIAVTVSSGDSGFGTSWPAANPFVTAVGGTRLVRGGGNRGWTETAWGGAGSGCSIYETKPSWQHDTGCSMRTIADVSADSDPSTGVAVYDTYGLPGWTVFGGTSVASPIIASTYTLMGVANKGNYGSLSYSHLNYFFDIVGGSNGSCTPPPSHLYLCTAVAGYDGPTGNGTPDGTGKP